MCNIILLSPNQTASSCLFSRAALAAYICGPGADPLPLLKQKVLLKFTPFPVESLAMNQVAVQSELRIRKVDL